MGWMGLKGGRYFMEQNIIPTNKESADLLRRILDNLVVPRGYTKSMLPFLRTSYALSKAIELLEKTPD